MKTIGNKKKTADQASLFFVVRLCKTRNLLSAAKCKNANCQNKGLIKDIENDLLYPTFATDKLKIRRYETDPDKTNYMPKESWRTKMRLGKWKKTKIINDRLKIEEKPLGQKYFNFLDKTNRHALTIEALW